VSPGALVVSHVLRLVSPCVPAILDWIRLDTPVVAVASSLPAKGTIKRGWGRGGPLPLDCLKRGRAHLRPLFMHCA